MIGADGEQLGTMTSEEAIERAETEGYDLVEVAPNSRPPVCRIMDYGKYKYEQKKKAAAAKSKGKALCSAAEASTRAVSAAPLASRNSLMCCFLALSLPKIVSNCNAVS